MAARRFVAGVKEPSEVYSIKAMPTTTATVTYEPDDVQSMSVTTLFSVSTKAPTSMIDVDWGAVSRSLAVTQ